MVNIPSDQWVYSGATVRHSAVRQHRAKLKAAARWGIELTHVPVLVYCVEYVLKLKMKSNLGSGTHEVFRVLTFPQLGGRYRRL